LLEGGVATGRPLLFTWADFLFLRCTTHKTQHPKKIPITTALAVLSPGKEKKRKKTAQLFFSMLI
jgi:hypothetical protein